MLAEFTLSLALLDFVPVILSAVAFALIAVWVDGPPALHKPAWIGATLASLGGLSKATWKLLVVLTGEDIRILDNALFILLTGGFVFLFVGMAFKLWNAQKWTWPTAVVLTVAFWGAAYATTLGPEPSRAWMFVLLGATTLVSTGLSIALIVMALRGKHMMAGLLILISVIGSFYLAYLGRLEQTVALQWLAEVVNTFSRAAFLMGVIWCLEQSALVRGWFKAPAPQTSDV